MLFDQKIKQRLDSQATVAANVKNLTILVEFRVALGKRLEQYFAWCETEADGASRYQNGHKPSGEAPYIDERRVCCVIYP